MLSPSHRGINLHPRANCSPTAMSLTHRNNPIPKEASNTLTGFSTSRNITNATALFNGNYYAVLSANYTETNFFPLPRFDGFPFRPLLFALGAIDASSPPPPSICLAHSARVSISFGAGPDLALFPRVVTSPSSMAACFRSGRGRGRLTVFDSAAFDPPSCIIS